METGQSHTKEWNWTTSLYHTQKLTQKGLKTWARLETIKSLGENIGGKLLGINLGDDFLTLTPKEKALRVKMNKIKSNYKASAQQIKFSTK